MYSMYMCNNSRGKNVEDRIEDSTALLLRNCALAPVFFFFLGEAGGGDSAYCYGVILSSSFSGNSQPILSSNPA